MTKTRDDAWSLVCEYVQDNGLRRHMLAAAMQAEADVLALDSRLATS